MDLKFLAKSIIEIILDPLKAWDTIYSASRPVSYINLRLFFPLIIIAAISAFLGSVLFINTGLLKTFSILAGMKYLLLYLVVINGTSLIVKNAAGALHIGMNFNISFKLIMYSSIPFLLCQAVSRLFESFIFINMLAFYGLYIMWTGTGKMLNQPEKKKLQLLFASTIIFLLSFFITNWFLNRVFDKLFYIIIA
jgi:hypothetical protein